MPPSHRPQSPDLFVAKARPCLFDKLHLTSEMSEEPAANSPDSPSSPLASASSAANASAAKRRAFKSRTISTVRLASTAFWFSQNWLFSIVCILLSGGALIEYFGLFTEPGFRRYRWQTYGVTVAYFCVSLSPLWGVELIEGSRLDSLALALLLVLIIGARIRHPLEGPKTLNEMTAAIFGFIYCVLLFGFMSKIFMLPLESTHGTPSASYYVLYLVAVTKLTDIGAYLVGSAIGRHKMIPHVSPGKTWQGFGGAILFAVAGSYTLYFTMGDLIPLITPVSAGILAVLLALAGILADLSESVLKRSLEAKDSGHVMPGIGGFLDLIDSMVFTSPLLYAYLIIFN